MDSVSIDYFFSGENCHELNNIKKKVIEVII